MVFELSRNLSFDEVNYEDGITRKSNGDKFEYYYIKTGKHVTQKDQERINKLKIPPAWEDVWISGDASTDIQATGIDIKGRKQYRYHEIHIEKAEQKKFLKMYDFILLIPKLEKIMDEDEKLSPYNKDRVIVSMLTIIKKLHMRVGKEVYARENKSYGVSSLKKIHMQFEGNKIMFRFKGKSNKRLFYSIEDKTLKDHLKLLLKLEGDKLFQYIDENNKVRKVTDTDLNQYIQMYMGDQFSAKDFRTYAANNYFIKSLLEETKKRVPKTQKVIKKNILTALKRTAFYLRHTKAISKKSYVMNFIIDLYQTNPEYFVDKKNDDPTDVLIDIIGKYKQHILNL